MFLPIRTSTGIQPAKYIRPGPADGIRFSSVASSIAAMSLTNGLMQSLQQSLIDLSSKTIVGGLARAEGNYSQADRPNPIDLIKHVLAGRAKFNWAVGVDEVFLEALEYLTMYFLPTLSSAVLFAPMLSKILGLPHFELLGKPAHSYSTKMGCSIRVGSAEPKQFVMNPKIYNRIMLGKLSLFAMTAAFCGALEFAVPSLRVILSKLFLGTQDFYKLSGFTSPTDETQERNTGNAMWRNIRIGLSIASASVPLIAGLTLALKPKLDRLSTVNRVLKRGASIFDMSDRFGLSRIMVATLMIGAAPGYLMGVRNAAERAEMFNRMICFAMPLVIFYRQVVGNLFAGLTGLASGLGNVLQDPRTYVQGLQRGVRDPFDLDLVGLKRQVDGSFYGSMLEKPAIKSLQAKRKILLERLNFAANRAPYWLALLLGLVINWLNYLNTYERHKHESVTRESSKDS